jgi:hypothetical protein
VSFTRMHRTLASSTLSTFHLRPALCTARFAHPRPQPRPRRRAFRWRTTTSVAYVDEVSVVMVQPFSWVLYNSVFMFVGAFGAGLLPLAVQLEDSRLRTVSPTCC